MMNVGTDGWLQLTALLNSSLVLIRHPLSYFCRFASFLWVIKNVTSCLVHTHIWNDKNSSEPFAFRCIIALHNRICSTCLGMNSCSSYFQMESVCAILVNNATSVSRNCPSNRRSSVLCPITQKKWQTYMKSNGQFQSGWNNFWPPSAATSGTFFLIISQSDFHFTLMIQYFHLRLQEKSCWCLSIMHGTALLQEQQIK